MSGRVAEFEIVWREVAFRVAAHFDASGRVVALGDVTLPWDRRNSAKALGEMCGAVIQADRYFRTPGPDGQQLIAMFDLVEALKPYGETAFVALLRVLAQAERDEFQAVSERRSAAFLSGMEDV
ncbi:hypothetical protein [Maricaulis maris]|uniref:Uncharacterized protein n=1 Tax=Maricaulis maris TaxID=74318 RepID=A0A495D1N7_9PROT|nr:hypothetical protein [Maricaulis maris]RKQ95448.1 hypothetical protein C7435_2550 [Maricaulis maris]